MKLISATPSPFARKIRIILHEKAIPFDLQTEVPWNDDTTLPSYNPLEKLPVLVLDDGSTVYESAFIAEWIERRHPHPPLLPADDDGILAHKRLEVLAGGVCDALVLIFFERRRAPGARSAPWLARQQRKVDGGLAETARLIGAGPYAVGDRFGLGDIAAGCMLGYLDLRLPELAWRTRHPALATYYARLAERPSFRATQPVAQAITARIV